MIPVPFIPTNPPDHVSSTMDFLREEIPLSPQFLADHYPPMTTFTDFTFELIHVALGAHSKQMTGTTDPLIAHGSNTRPKKYVLKVRLLHIKPTGHGHSCQDRDANFSHDFCEQYEKFNSKLTVSEIRKGGENNRDKSGFVEYLCNWKCGVYELMRIIFDK